MKQDLIAYLKSCKVILEDSSKYESGDSIGLTYLYFSPIKERLSIHRNEKFLNYFSVLSFTSNQTQENQNHIINFKPYFDEAIKRKNIKSIASHPFDGLEEITDKRKEKFIKSLKKIEVSKGIFRALLILRGKAFFFKTIRLGDVLRKKLSINYLRVILHELRISFLEDDEMQIFLNWCGKRIQKILSWGFKNKELRSPPKSALPIYKNEAASYLKYFIEMVCNKESSKKQQYAEMVVYLALCFAAGRRHSNGFQSHEILSVTSASIFEIQPIIKKVFSNTKDTREKSKGNHENLLLKLTTNFLNDESIWSQQVVSEASKKNDSFCKIIKINGKPVLISQTLAEAIQIMGRFTLKPKDVANRLQEAYQIIGLSQSSGGISPRTFLCHPHFWEKVDVRKYWKEKISKKNF